jgi:hypothetical protein
VSCRGHGEPRQSIARTTRARARKVALTRHERATHAPRYVGAPRPREPKPRRAGATLRRGAMPRRDRGRGPRAATRRATTSWSRARHAARWARGGGRTQGGGARPHRAGVVPWPRAEAAPRWWEHARRGGEATRAGAGRRGRASAREREGGRAGLRKEKGGWGG